MNVIKSRDQIRNSSPYPQPPPMVPVSVRWIHRAPKPEEVMLKMADSVVLAVRSSEAEGLSSLLVLSDG
jgi:hypothetical protein